MSSEVHRALCLYGATEFARTVFDDEIERVLYQLGQDHRIAINHTKLNGKVFHPETAEYILRDGTSRTFALDDSKDAHDQIRLLLIEAPLSF